jgi:lipid-binding SYLF domain-containing protein
MKKITALLCTAFALTSSASFAATDHQKLVARLNAGTAVLHEMMATPDKGIPLQIASSATCVAVVPGFKKGAFLVGAQYGQGMATCRVGHHWSAPVFIQLTGASFGLQAGGQSTDLVLVGTNHKSMDDMLKEKLKLGGDVAASAGPVGRNSQAATSILANAEFLSYSRSKGLFAGVDLTGDVVNQNVDDTQTFYGKDHTYQSILSGEVPTPVEAKQFTATVARLFREGKVQAAK